LLPKEDRAIIFIGEDCFAGCGQLECRHPNHKTRLMKRLGHIDPDAQKQILAVLTEMFAE